MVDTAPTDDVPSAGTENPPAQTEPEIIVHVVLPLVQVEWNEPRLGSPLNAVHADSAGLQSWDERWDIVRELIPEVRGFENVMPATVAISRDGELMLVGINLLDGRGLENENIPSSKFVLKLFLYARGSWFEVSHSKSPTKDTFPAIAVSETNGVIYLAVRENTVREMWRHAVLATNDLP